MDMFAFCDYWEAFLTVGRKKGPDGLLRDLSPLLPGRELPCPYHSFPFMFFCVVHVAGAWSGRGFLVQVSPFLWRLRRGCWGGLVFDSQCEGKPLEAVIWLTFLKRFLCCM